LHAFTGEVVDEKKWSTTQVSGGGGGYNVGSGRNNPVTISSVSHTHDQFFLKNESGQEKVVETVNAGLAIRKGHRVTVMWGVLQGMERGQYLAIYNHTTDTLTRFDAAIQGLAMKPAPGLLPLAWIASIFGICVYGLGIIGIIVLFILGRQRNRKNKERADLFRPEVDRAIAEMKGA
jgi:hypothetical protein